jgi:gamma-glutamylcyclotransferase (GGCT)/AIG2-like uncharacterized protein YtfP
MKYHSLYKNHLNYLGKEELKGFKMFSLGDYPYIVKTENSGDRIIAELFQITNHETEQTIYELEIGAGYIFSEVEIGNIKFGIYLFESSAIGDPEVRDGDWSTFRKLQGF